MIEDEDIEIEDTQREDRHDLMMRLLMWREKHINEHNFVLILSFIIGICTAAAALILKFLIHFIQQLLTSHFNADSDGIKKYQSWCHPYTLCHIAKEKPA